MVVLARPGRRDGVLRKEDEEAAGGGIRGGVTGPDSWGGAGFDAGAAGCGAEIVSSAVFGDGAGTGVDENGIFGDSQVEGGSCDKGVDEVEVDQFGDEKSAS